MNTYNISFKTFLVNMFFFILMMLFFGLVSNKLKITLFISLVLIVIYLTSFFIKRLVSITLDKNKQSVSLKYKRLFFITEIKEYKYEDIVFSLDYEIGARGIKNKVFNISYKGEKIEKITARSYFWSYNILENIIKDFNS